MAHEPAHPTSQTPSKMRRAWRPAATVAAAFALLAGAAAHMSRPAAQAGEMSYAIVAEAEDAPAIQFLQATRSSLAPASLEEALARMEAEARAEGKLIRSLFFVGHGGTAESGPPLGAITVGGKDYGQAEFEALKQSHPKLSELFAPGARIYMLNCYVGGDSAFAQAVGQLFLSANGGKVWAKSGKVAEWNVFDGWYYWIETPDSPSSDPRAVGVWSAWDVPAQPAPTSDSTPEPTPEATPQPTPETMMASTPVPTPRPTPVSTPRPTPQPTAMPTPRGTPSGACTQWDVSGTWQTSQGNNYHVTFIFQQTGTSIGGSVRLPADEQARAGYTSPTGSVSGSLVGDKIDVAVTWSGGNGPVTGRYTGAVTEGRINGNAGTVSWSGSGPTGCVR